MSERNVFFIPGQQYFLIFISKYADETKSIATENFISFFFLHFSVLSHRQTSNLFKMFRHLENRRLKGERLFMVKCAK